MSRASKYFTAGPCHTKTKAKIEPTLVPNIAGKVAVFHIMKALLAFASTYSETMLVR